MVQFVHYTISEHFFIVFFFWMAGKYNWSLIDGADYKDGGKVFSENAGKLK